MAMTTHSARRAALLPAFLLAVLVLVLALDTVLRVLEWRDRLETSGYVTLLAFESMRVLLVAGAAALALLAERQSRRHAEAGWFGLGALLLAVAAARTLAGPLPGAGQEALAGALLARGVPQTVLAIVFVRAEWVAWLALPPLLHFAACYPLRLRSDDVLLSGVRDRAGALRGVPGAGVDVGLLGRRFAATLLDRGWLNMGRLWAAATVTGALHTAAVVLLTGPARTTVSVAAALFALLAAAVFIALLRANWHAGEPSERGFHGSLRSGAALTAVLLVVTVVTTMSGTGLALGAVTLYLAPLALLLAALRAITLVRDAPAHAPR
jgi:hypothetical protein